ncbi:MAG: hypothetical protein IPJ71_18315 [Bdellovibrionales bacterium]|nr:hypothetical protein [Bdellovibrionales bacterium]
MTNKHCVENVTDCAEELAFRFPDTSESAQCQKILKISEFPLKDKNKLITQVPDYAIILLDRKLTAKALPLSQDGLVAKSPITIRKAWSTGNRSYEMRESSCETGVPNPFTIHYTAPTSPVISLFGCLAQHGVSGSPVLNSKGEVAAILSDGIDETKLFHPIDKSQKQDDFNPLNLSYATNLSCVDYSSLGLYPRKTGCEVPYIDDIGVHLESKGQDFFTQSESNAKAELLKFVESTDLSEYKTEGSYEEIFEWTVRADDGQRVKFDKPGIRDVTIEMVPECVSRPENPNNPLKAKFYKEDTPGESERWKFSDKVTLDTPGWAMTRKLDKYGGAINAKLERGRKAAKYIIHPREIASLKEGQTVLVVEIVNGQWIDLRLPLCKDKTPADNNGILPRSDELTGTGRDSTKN